MKRYYVGDDGLVEHAYGSWISYADHLKALAAQRAEAVSPQDTVPVPLEVVKFLLGEGPLEGVHFGEEHSLRSARFWWRSLLRLSVRPLDGEGGPLGSDKT